MYRVDVPENVDIYENHHNFIIISVFSNFLCGLKGERQNYDPNYRLSFHRLKFCNMAISRAAWSWSMNHTAKMWCFWQSIRKKCGEYNESDFMRRKSFLLPGDRHYITTKTKILSLRTGEASLWPISFKRPLPNEQIQVTITQFFKNYQTPDS